jgi:hypothetical protein
MAYQDGIEIATLVTYLNRKFVDQVFEGTPLLEKLRARQKSFVGRKAVEPLMTSGNTTGQWMASGYDEIDLTPQAGLEKAEFPLASFTHSVVMSDLERDQNKGPDERIDLWTAKVEQARLTAIDFLSSGLHSDGTSQANQITGLLAMVLDTGTYAGINRATAGNEYWKAYVDSTAEVLTDDDMMTAYNTASRGGRTYPDLILTTQALWEKYALTLTPNVRYDDVNKANLGFRQLQFMGAPVFWDPDVPTGYMYFLNTKFINLRYLQGWNFSWTPERKPSRQLVTAIICKWAGALTTNSPRHQALLSGKT